jgi:ketosteroid isomerase-like protein
MSEENVEIVRQPISLGAHSRRRLEERLALRFPRVLALGANAAWRFRPSSRLRRALLRHSVRLGFEASNRGDHEATFILYHADCESIVPAQLASLGEPGTRGREERIRWQRRWSAEWGEFRFEPKEVIDLGDRQLVVGHIRGSGSSSGAAVDSEWAALFTSSAGRVFREQVFLDHGEALEAAGLSE